MQVYKAFMKISAKLLPSMIIYVVIFVGVNLMIGGMTESTTNSGFSSTKEAIYINDLDNTDASRALCEYIAEKHDIFELESYDEEFLQDNLYYRTLSYVLTIKQGYEENLTNGISDGLVEKASVSGSFSSAYVDSDITLYINDVRMFLAGGCDMQTALEKTAELVNADGVEATIESFEGSAKAETPGWYFFYRFLPYVLPAIIISGIAPVLITMNKKDIGRRLNCSPLSTTKITLQKTLGTMTLCIAFWLIFVVIAVIIYPEGLFSPERLTAVANSFVLLLVSAGIAILVSSFCKKNDYVIAMINNVYVLGSCFLCGVFVQQDILGDGVVAVSKFLPTFWFTKANDMLGGIQAYDSGELALCFGIQGLFVLLLFAAALLSGKIKRTSNS